MPIPSTDELTIHLDLLVKGDRNPTFDQAVLAGWKGVQFHPCQPDHPDKAGYGVFTVVNGRPGEFCSYFTRLKDALAEIEGDSS